MLLGWFDKIVKNADYSTAVYSSAEFSFSKFFHPSIILRPILPQLNFPGRFFRSQFSRGQFTAVPHRLSDTLKANGCIITNLKAKFVFHLKTATASRFSILNTTSVHPFKILDKFMGAF